MNNQFKLLEQQLLNFQLTRNDADKQTSLTNIYSLLEHLFSLIIQDLKGFETLTPSLLNVLEKKDEISVNSILYNYIIEKLNYDILLREFPSLFDVYKTTSEFDVFAREALDEAMNQNDKINHELFDRKIFPPSIKEAEKKLWLSYLESFLIKDLFNKGTWDSNYLQTATYVLELFEMIAEDDFERESFYRNFNMILGKLNSYYLLERLPEIILRISYKDCKQEFGFFALARSFRIMNNSACSLLMTCLSLYSINKRNDVNEELFRLINEEALEMASTLNLKREVDYLYNMIQTKLNLYGHLPVNLTGKYYHALISMGAIDKFSAMNLLKYTYKNDIILKLGNRLALHFLSLIFSVKEFLKNEDLKFWNDVILWFKSFVTSDAFLNLQSIYEGNIDTMGDIYNELKSIENIENISGILKREETRVFFFHKKCISNNNHKGFLSSLLLKGDLAVALKSISFIKKSYPAFPKDCYEDPFENYPLTIKKQFYSNNLVCFISTINNDIFTLLLFKDQYLGVNKLGCLNLSQMNHFINSVINFTRLGYEEQKRLIKKDSDRFNFYKSFTLPILIDSYNGVYIAYDIRVSHFPHNLILDEDGNYLSLRTYVANIISLELFQTQQKEVSKGTQIECYIPTEKNDDALHMVYNHPDFVRLKRNYPIKITQNLQPDKPMSSPINIIYAHGAADIFRFSTLTSGRTTFSNMNAIIGEGEIAILFVCNAGFQIRSEYSNKVLSFTRTLFLKGYKTVIAPFWDLSIDVPNPWLAEFLKNIYAEKTVGESFYLASKSIYNLNQDPYKWACLHLFGNPDIRLK